MKQIEKVRKLLDTYDYRTVSEAIIYRELHTFCKSKNVSDKEITNIIDDCYNKYLNNDHATLMGISFGALDYLKDLYEHGKTVADWDYLDFCEFYKYI